MKLYGSYTSPYVRHCRIALLEAGVTFEFIETDQAASANKSPTKRVPFLEDGDIFLTDSSAIIRHAREKVGTRFLPGIAELNQYCMVNAALDSCTNLFFLQRDGVDIQAYEYTKRQAARIESSLAELNSLLLPTQAPYNDVHLRLGCFLAWALFRNRITLDAHKKLHTFLNGMNTYQPFANTAPPV
ncbi:MAG: glutathione S-transferase [Gammaproteobacteria bacterium]|nr:MAG: glutathione S-transferase [Gammaproteobacteria bacterium]